MIQQKEERSCYIPEIHLIHVTNMLEDLYIVLSSNVWVAGMSAYSEHGADTRDRAWGFLTSKRGLGAL